MEGAVGHEEALTAYMEGAAGFEGMVAAYMEGTAGHEVRPCRQGRVLKVIWHSG